MIKSGPIIQLEETKEAVHDWILYQFTNKQYDNDLAHNAYQSLIKKLQINEI